MLSIRATEPEDGRYHLSNPLLPLPEFDLDSIDAALITHTHPDHFDDAASEVLRTGLPGDVPVFCQPEDGETLRSSGLAVQGLTEQVLLPADGERMEF